jgi:hypothetical protein
MRARALVDKRLHAYEDVTGPFIQWDAGEEIEVVMSLFGGSVLKVKKGGEFYYTLAHSVEKVA